MAPTGGILKTGQMQSPRRSPATGRLIAIAFCLVAQLGLPRHAIAGEIKGTAFEHTASSRIGVIQNANVALPATVTGKAIFFGKWRDRPSVTQAKVPVVIFLHGSSGLGLKAIEEWQVWLAQRGIASVAPDSFALTNRVTYTSPIAKDLYERIHALRASEIDIAREAIAGTRWADLSHLALAGTSEGAVAVARHAGREFVARMIFSWSCENNYFVETHRTAVLTDQPVLNVISANDPFFSRDNDWLGNPVAQGHCAPTLRGAKAAVIVLIPGAPHTLLNFPAARHAVEGFIDDTLLRQ